MKSLKEDWFYAELLDIEYKRYTLLAWLADVQQQFNQTKLYPPLADLVKHYRNLKEFLKLKEELSNGFPKNLNGLDINAFKLSFEAVFSEIESFKIIEEIVHYSLPLIEKHLEEGKEIYEFVESILSIHPVGIEPLYKNEGYLIIKDGDIADLSVYNYSIKLFENQHTQYRAVSTTLIDKYKNSAFHTGENIKIDLIKKFKKLPNPATYFVYSEFAFPMEETLLQIVKRKLNEVIA